MILEVHREPQFIALCGKLLIILGKKDVHIINSFPKKHRMFFLIVSHIRFILLTAIFISCSFAFSLKVQGLWNYVEMMFRSYVFYFLYHVFELHFNCLLFLTLKPSLLLTQYPFFFSFCCHFDEKKRRQKKYKKIEICFWCKSFSWWEFVFAKREEKMEKFPLWHVEGCASKISSFHRSSPFD